MRPVHRFTLHVRWPNVESKLVKGNPSDFTKFKVLLAKVYVYIYYIYPPGNDHISPFAAELPWIRIFLFKERSKENQLFHLLRKDHGPKKKASKSRFRFETNRFTKVFYRYNATLLGVIVLEEAVPLPSCISYLWGVFVFKDQRKSSPNSEWCPMHLETSSACALKFASREMSIRNVNTLQTSSKLTSSNTKLNHRCSHLSITLVTNIVPALSTALTTIQLLWIAALW